MKETNKDHLTRLTEKMEELQNSGKKLSEKEDRFRSALGTRLKTPPNSSKK